MRLILRCAADPFVRNFMKKLFAKFASGTAKAAGHPVAFLLAVASIAIWAVTGPILTGSNRMSYLGSRMNESFPPVIPQSIRCFR